jgi:hypothetical protein
MIRLAAVLVIASAAACAGDSPELRSTQASETRPFNAHACDHVAQIREIPVKQGLLVSDPHYNALKSDPKWAKDCLLDLVTDETPMTDPRLNHPSKVDGFVVGDLAFFLLSDFGLVSFDAIMAMAKVDLSQLGVLDYFEWVKKPGNRSKLQALCREWIEKNEIEAKNKAEGR